jgi:hypothetical protein
LHAGTSADSKSKLPAKYAGSRQKSPQSPILPALAGVAWVPAALKNLNYCAKIHYQNGHLSHRPKEVGIKLKALNITRPTSDSVIAN